MAATTNQGLHELPGPPPVMAAVASDEPSADATALATTPDATPRATTESDTVSEAQQGASNGETLRGCRVARVAKLFH